MKPSTQIFKDLLHLIYPQLCIGCLSEAVSGQELFCVECESHLHVTDLHTYAPNECTSRIEGGFPFHFGCSMFRFYGGGRVQTMIHRLKYRNETMIGTRLGQRYGALIKTQTLLADVSVVVPVPLHRHKLRSRGYNQSDYFAKGLASIMNIAWDPNLLIRSKKTQTQTDKTRGERIENMKNAFALKRKKNYAHILLVDDVITTGSTIEACADTLNGLGDVKVSFASIAIAQ